MTAWKTRLALVFGFAIATSTLAVRAESPAANPTYTAPVLAEATIQNQTLHIGLRQGGMVLLYNSRGQLIYRMEAHRGLESIPLKGIDFGFLFLTVRQGKLETTLRLLHNGK